MPLTSTASRPQFAVWMTGFVVGVLLLAAVDAIVLQRSDQTDGHWFGLSADTAKYLAMMDGERVRPPFGHRVLVPALASSLPLQPLTALKYVTYFCFVAAVAFNFATLSRFGVPAAAAVFALVAWAGTLRAMVLVQNPFMTDAASLLASSAMFYFAASDRPRAFGVSAFLGVLAREDALFPAPTWLLAGRYRAGIAILVVALSAYAIPRLLDPGFHVRPDAIWGPLSVSYYVKIYFAFGWVWLLALLGLAQLRSVDRKVLVFIGLAVAGVLVSSIVVVDRVRIVLPLVPIVVLGLGLAARRIVTDPLLRRYGLVLLVVGPVVAAPNVLFGAALELAELEVWYRSHFVAITGVQLGGLIFCVSYWGRFGFEAPTKD